MRVIDLFAGCGGLSTGFIKSGYKIVKAVEFDKTIALTYKNNHPDVSIIVNDIKNIDLTNIFDNAEANIIIGGPPCQGFSMAGARIRNGFIDDPRNYLFKHYFNIVKKVLPKVFIMENVKGITTMDKGQIFDEILNSFKNKELLDGNFYNVYHKIIKVKEFGIPQNRERVIIIGVLNKKLNIDSLFAKTYKKIQKKYSSYFDKCSVWDAISNLEFPTENGIIKNNEPQTNYQIQLATKNKFIHNHVKTNHSELVINRMNKIIGGENYTKLNENIKSIHSGSYGRLLKDGIAPTITTRFDTPSGGMFIHPLYNRTITPREAARLQSFSDDFIFYGSKTSICKQIGNAVPPKISYFLAELLKIILNEN